MFSPVAEIELRHLAALRAIVEEGTFRGAADVLGYSQAAISQQISALEEALGHAVFDRPGGPRAVRLTPAGRTLVRHAEDILDRVAEARTEIDLLSSGRGGRLACGTFQSVSVQLLPEIVGRLLRESPALQIRVVEEDENEPLLARLRSGELDVAFLAGTVHDPDIDIIELGLDPFVAVVSAASISLDLTAYPTLGLSDIGLIGEHRGTAQAFVEDGLRSVGVQPRYLFRTNDNGAIQAMARTGLGPAVMPHLAVDTGDPGVRVLPLEPPIPPRSILLGLPRGAQRTPAADRFAEIGIEVGRARLG